MFLSKISTGPRRKLGIIATETTAVLKRLLITKKSEGVYSFEPDLILHSNTNTPSGSTEIPQYRYYERPTPVVFITGEGLPAKM
jgi:hypothetical protein